MLNTMQEQMKEEVLYELKRDEDATLDDIRDNAGEWVDGYLPLYTNKIIEEWQQMPSEYDDRGALELGQMGETTITGLMSLDLYLYYSDLFNEVLDDIESEQESEA